MKAQWTLLAAVAGLCGTTPALAQAVAARSPAIDSASIEVPDLRHEPGSGSAGRYFKYFLFHKTGVSYADAVADLSECYQAREAVGVNRLPFYAQVEGGIDRPKPARGTAPYGVVGAVLSGMIERDAKFELRQAALRMCMRFKGYARFGVPKEIWARVADRPAAEAIVIQAKIASNPMPPPGEKVKP